MDDKETFEEIVGRLRQGDPVAAEAVKRELSTLSVSRSSRLALEPGKDWYVIRVAQPE